MRGGCMKGEKKRGAPSTNIAWRRYSYVYFVLGGDREWTPPWIPTPRDHQDTAQVPYYEDHTVYLSSPGLHNGSHVLDH